jgi:hypothetical protein
VRKRRNPLAEPLDSGLGEHAQVALQTDDLVRMLVRGSKIDTTSPRTNSYTP